MKNQPLIEQAMSILKEHGYKYTKKRSYHYLFSETQPLFAGKRNP